MAIVDSTGSVAQELRTLIDPKTIAARRAEEVRQALARAPEPVRQMSEDSGGGNRAAEAALGPVPELRLIERPATADIQQDVKILLKAQVVMGEQMREGFANVTDAFAKLTEGFARLTEAQQHSGHDVGHVPGQLKRESLGSAHDTAVTAEQRRHHVQDTHLRHRHAERLMTPSST